MLRSLRNRGIAWLIESQPRLFLRWKKLTGHAVASDPAFLRLHAQMIREGEGVQRLLERYHLWSWAKRMAGKPGAFAELGVYRGGSARILCEVKGKAPLYLFDTFEGMPTVNPATDGSFKEGDFADGPLASVQAYLRNYEGVKFFPGFFPASAASLLGEKLTFQFVHLDVDLYQSTLDGLRFFYPRLAPGAILISHDYGDPTVPGVRRAFDEFMCDKPETLIALADTQVMFEKAGA